MNSPGHRSDDNKLKAIRGIHVTARKLIDILNGNEKGLGDEIQKEYEAGTIDFTKLTLKFSEKLRKILGINNLGISTWRSILHRVLAGYKGGKCGESYPGLFPEAEYKSLQEKKIITTRVKGTEQRAKTKGTLLWTPEMENRLMELSNATKRYQPGRLQKIAEIMEQEFQKKFTQGALVQKIRRIDKKRST